MIYGNRIKSTSASQLRALINRIIPNTCPLCKDHVEGAHMICAKCWHHLPFIDGPTCECCGVGIMGVGENLCEACWNLPRTWARGYSTVEYGERTKHLILQFKNGGGAIYAPALAQAMYSRHKSAFEGVDYIAAMPLHWRRLFMRSYNQAGLLANHLSELSGVPYNRHALKRVRYTKKQGKSAGFEARFQNIEKAIDVPDEQREIINGKHILIIDDVLTSGASLENCAHALRQAGARQIDVLVFARAGING